MAVRERANRLRPETEQALVLSSVGAWITCLRLVHGTSVLIGASVPHAFEIVFGCNFSRSATATDKLRVPLQLLRLLYNTQKTCTAIAASHICASHVCRIRWTLLVDVIHPPIQCCCVQLQLQLSFCGANFTAHCSQTVHINILNFLLCQMFSHRHVHLYRRCPFNICA